LVVENRDEEKGDPGPYVLTGAALGALALGGAAALAADCNDDCMFLGQGIAIAAGIGAVVGGFVRWLAYEIVHHRPGPGP
ncbi:MAG TPA: hypothetical protein VJ840_11050, partial [Gemmatimonadaceae bacterium]|nr:hypothetical protein [Gemmatimonadaceae bacterium]